MAGRTISEALGNDHKTIDGYAEKIKSSTTLDDKTKWRNQFTWALARHAISEELTVYPAMEKHLGQEGVELTNLDREQHQAVGKPHNPTTSTNTADTLTGKGRPLQTPEHVPRRQPILPTPRPPPRRSTHPH